MLQMLKGTVQLIMACGQNGVYIAEATLLFEGWRRLNVNTLRLLEADLELRCREENWFEDYNDYLIPKHRCGYIS